MKTFKHVFLAFVTSLLLTAGLAKAAESFDVVTRSHQVQAAAIGPGVSPCIVPS
jgi:hypothetical protein